MEIKKVLSRIVAVSAFAFALLHSISASADITYHAYVNGTHYVSCTGGCSFSNGGWGRTTVCDSANLCMNYFGQVKEGEYGIPGDPAGND